MEWYVQWTVRPKPVASGMPSLEEALLGGLNLNFPAFSVRVCEAFVDTFSIRRSKAKMGA